MIPQNVKVLLLADRGFGRTVMAQFCRGQNFSYLIRIQPNVKVNLKSFEGKLLDYPVKKGIARLQQPNRLSK
jgi:ketol-acid reductoisomerase